jgi:hypothetical protein
MLRIPHCLDNRLIDGGKFNDVSTIWVYKSTITRMVGRLFVSLNEVLETVSHVVCDDMPV